MSREVWEALRPALNAIADIAGYWNIQYAKTFPGAFKPVTRFISWDSTAPRAGALDGEDACLKTYR